MKCSEQANLYRQKDYHWPRAGENGRLRGMAEGCRVPVLGGALKVMLWWRHNFVITLKAFELHTKWVSCMVYEFHKVVKNTVTPEDPWGRSLLGRGHSREWQWWANPLYQQTFLSFKRSTTCSSPACFHCHHPHPSRHPLPSGPLQ